MHNAEHNAAITVSFYDSNKKLMGICKGFIDELAPGGTKVFVAADFSDYSNHSSYKIQIDSLY